MDNNIIINNDWEGVPVIGISRHRLGSDGKGVATLVAFHGCNLRCKYCLNPESLGCDDGLERYTPESLYEKVKIDDLYFRSTGGGITFGGGEPCLQADFIVRFRELCGNDWKIRVETSLNAPFHNIEQLIPVIDEWIVDIKTDDKEVYERYTGQRFEPAYQHLRWLMTQLGYNSDRLTLRVPVIPGYVDEEMANATKERFEYSGVSRIDRLTYRTEKPNHEYRNENGKRKCELMKLIRRDLAEQFGIQIHERECHQEGGCHGTCPLCDHELESLTQQIKVIGPGHIQLSDEVAEKCGLNVLRHSSIVSPVPATDELPLEGQVLEGEIMFPPEPHFEYKKVFFKECAIAGLSFHLEKDDELWDELCEGTKLALIRERNNKYDKNAVAVALADDYDGDPDDFDFDFILGYIPRTHNTEIAAMMDAGYADKFEAEITAYHRYGNYNDRICITIWLLSKEAEEVRPDKLRIQSLGFSECKTMIEELQRRGTVHFRWGGFNDQPLNLPIVGEEVVLIRRQATKALLFRMKVIAEGEDCVPFLDDPDEIQYVDDRATFVLTNIAGPVTVDVKQLHFLDVETLGKREVYDWLSDEVDSGLRELFKRELNEWLPGNNIDMDPSIDDL